MGWMTPTFITLLESWAGERCLDPALEMRPLHGGLVACGVQQIRIVYRNQHGKRRLAHVVAKELSGPASRERWVYELLDGWSAGPIAPRLLGVEERPTDASMLYLESVTRTRAWPWRDTHLVQRVLESLAVVHAKAAAIDELPAPLAWDYDDELEDQAQATLELLERSRRRLDPATLARSIPATRRVVRALPAMRYQLRAFQPLGQGVIHGDVHPGNVLVRRRASRAEPVLIDWGRARLGSPLEDVSSWLQSLGCWEPEARRRHDTLLRAYLSARGLDDRLSPDLRAAYWLAGASNALAGALRYHLALASAARARRQRGAAIRAASHWLRVIRRADAYWS
jgi:aminoglycoside phosphotransferase (APT) family kinase protein